MVQPRNMVSGCQRLPHVAALSFLTHLNSQQEIKMSQVIRVFSACFLLFIPVVIASGQNNLTAKANVQPKPASPDGSRNGSESDRVRDGLLGPVRRVRTEVVKVSAVAGKSVEDSKHVVLETAEYDLKGVKTQNQYFPIEGATLTGREVYKYDDNGNISKMISVNPQAHMVTTA